MRKWMWLVGAAVLLATQICVSAQEATAEAKPKVRYGADLRLREELFDKIPLQNGAFARGGENDYFRIRPRIWGEADLLDSVTLRARVVNEFRIWNEPDMDGLPDSRTYDFPDEWVFDNLYLDVRGLLDNKLDLRVGRQDLIYGTGKVILEGTPGDGSRTIYFNAVKATLKVVPETTIDVFGIYNPGEDDFAINSSERNVTAYPGTKPDDVSESGGGVYVMNKTMKELPFEAYAIFKNEEDYATAAKTNAAGFVPPALAWQTLNTANKTVENPALDLWTAGVRLMPKFNDDVKGNLEMACQAGERGDEDVSGYMVDGSVFYNLPVMKSVSPVIDAGVYCLSGDDPKTDKDEGWNPIWARYPQLSELYVYGYDATAGRWSNLIMPNVGLVANPTKRIKATAKVGYMTAMEDDGPGTGKERGWLEIVKGEFTISEKMLTQSDKLTGHLWLELLQPGDYYVENDTAYFARWELMYAF